MLGQLYGIRVQFRCDARFAHVPQELQARNDGGLAEVRDEQLRACSQFRRELVRLQQHIVDAIGTEADAHTAHVLEAIRLNKVVRSAVIVSSDKCYHNKKIQWAYTESDALGGHDPYSASKGACEIVAASYIDSFFRGSEKGIATARAGNVIGGGDFARDRIVPDCIQALQAERGLNLRFPFATRPWQHVLEPLSGYVLLAERLHQSPSKYSEAWNFGPRRGAEISVESLVKQLAKKWGFDLRVSTPNDPQPYEAQFLSLDCGKANERLGWFPRLSIEETLDWTVEWYKAFFDSKELALEVAQSQIERYEKIRVGA